MAKNKREGAKKPAPEQQPIKETKKNEQTPPPVLLSDEPLGGIIGFLGNFRLIAPLLALFSCLIYVNTIPNKYAVDDAIVITRNQFTAKGFKGMKGIWGEDTFVGFFGDSKNLVMGGRYRPFSVATFALENQLFGSTVTNRSGADMVTTVKGLPTVIKPNQPILDKDGDVNYEGNPHISHFINILLYALLVVFLYWLFLELFNPERDPGFLRANFIAFAAALLYAAHPIHTEAVANIKGRDEILVLLGSVMALYWTVKAYNHRRRNPEDQQQDYRYMAYALLGFLMGIFSKENAITFVAIIPVAMYVFTPAKLSEIALRTAPFLAASLLFWFGVRNLIFMDMNTYDIAKEYMNDPFMKVVKDANGVVDYPYMTPNERYGFIVYTWLVYIKLLIFPHPLTNDYYPLHLTYDPEGEVIPSFGHPMTLLSVLLHLGLGAAFVWTLLRRHAMAFAIIFYAATFSVVSNLFFAIGTVMAERFMFLPSVGFSLACALGLWYLGERLHRRKEQGAELSVAALRLPLLITVVVAGLYGIKTFTRNYAWKNDQILFITDIEVSKNSAKLNNAVSGVYQEYLVDELRLPLTDPGIKKRADYIEKAIYHANRAIDMHPMYNQAWLLLGNAQVYKGDHLMSLVNIGDVAKLDSALLYYRTANETYRKVLNLRYDHQDAIKNMWVSYNKLASAIEKKGILALSQQNVPQATADFELAAAQYDTLIDYLLNEYPRLYANFQHPDIRSVLGAAYRERGQVYGKRLGRLDDAIASLNVASGYLPGDANVLRMLGVAHGIKGLHLQAIDFFEKALQAGFNIAIVFNLEIAYGELLKQAIADKADAAVIAGYEAKKKEYHDRWFAVNPNYDPSKEE